MKKTLHGSRAASLAVPCLMAICIASCGSDDGRIAPAVPTTPAAVPERRPAPATTPEEMQVAASPHRDSRGPLAFPEGWNLERVLANPQLSEALKKVEPTLRLRFEDWREKWAAEGVSPEVIQRRMNIVDRVLEAFREGKFATSDAVLSHKGASLISPDSGVNWDAVGIMTAGFPTVAQELASVASGACAWSSLMCQARATAAYCLCWVVHAPSGSRMQLPR